MESDSKKLNNMCSDCQHLHVCCDGTTSQVWSGCVIKDADPEDAAAYIESMAQAIRKDIDPAGAILTESIEEQAAEANTPAADLTDEQIINNRFL